jgi:hypothetical protein
MSPHCSAIFLQHSRSADVIAAPGNTHAATGSAASISARAETPTLINSFTITSLSAAESKTQQAGKGFTFRRSREPFIFGCPLAVQQGFLGGPYKVFRGLPASCRLLKVLIIVARDLRLLRIPWSSLDNQTLLLPAVCKSGFVHVGLCFSGKQQTVLLGASGD